MSPESAAAVHATETEIAERFAAYGIPEPTEKAAGLIRWMQRRGWRVHPVLADRPGPPSRPPSPTARQHLADARAAVNAKRGNRPEQETTP